MAKTDMKTLRLVSAAIKRDRALYMAGTISENEYFSRVHKRDEWITAMSPAERARVNRLLMSMTWPNPSR
jgi:hypothetical protein